MRRALYIFLGAALALGCPSARQSDAHDAAPEPRAPPPPQASAEACANAREPLLVDELALVDARAMIDRHALRHGGIAPSLPKRWQTLLTAVVPDAERVGPSRFHVGAEAIALSLRPTGCDLMKIDLDRTSGPMMADPYGVTYQSSGDGVACVREEGDRHEHWREVLRDGGAVP